MSLYSKFYTQWFNKPNKTTPATAEAMNHIEAGILDSSQTAYGAINNIEHSSEDQQTVIDGLHYRKPTFNASRASGRNTLFQPNEFYATPVTISELKSGLPSGGEGSSFITFGVSYPDDHIVVNPTTELWTRVIWMFNSNGGYSYLILSAHKLDDTHGYFSITGAEVPRPDDTNFNKRFISNDIVLNWLKCQAYGTKSNRDIALVYGDTEYKLPFSDYAPSIPNYSYTDDGQTYIPYDLYGPVLSYSFDSAHGLPDGFDMDDIPDQIKIENYIPVINDRYASQSTTYSSSKITNLFNSIDPSQDRYEIARIKNYVGMRITIDIVVQSPDLPTSPGDLDPSVVDVWVVANMGTVDLFQSKSTDTDHLVYDTLTNTETVSLSNHTVVCTLTPPANNTDNLTITVTVDGGEPHVSTFRPYDGEHTSSGYQSSDSFTLEF